MRELKFRLGDYEFISHLSEIRPSQSADYSVGRHSNMEYELFVMLEGHCKMDVEAQSYEMGVGDALIVAPTKFHCPGESSSDASYLIFPFVLTDTKAAREFNLKVIPCKKLAFSNKTIELCRNIHDEAKQQNLFWQDTVEAMYVQLAIELLRSVLPSEPQKDFEDTAVQVGRFGIIDCFFEEHCKNHGTAQMLAQELHISPRQLNRVLLTHYRMSYREKLLRTRMDRAAWLLRTTDLSVGQISEAVGYMSETSFFKAFKAYHGITPKAYRKGCRGDTE